MPTINYEEGVDLESLQSRHASAELAKEAASFRTVPSGEYLLRPEKVKVGVTPEENKYPGRLEANVQYSAYNEENVKVGTVFARVSPERFTIQTKNGPMLEGACRLWGQGTAAFGLGEASDRDIIEAFGTYPLKGYVTESYKMPSGVYVTAKTADERKELSEKGGEPKNYVQNFKKVK